MTGRKSGEVVCPPHLDKSRCLYCAHATTRLWSLTMLHFSLGDFANLRQRLTVCFRNDSGRSTACRVRVHQGIFAARQPRRAKRYQLHPAQPLVEGRGQAGYTNIYVKGPRLPHSCRRHFLFPRLQSFVCKGFYTPRTNLRRK
jgi:hypothetical protein